MRRGGKRHEAVTFIRKGDTKPRVVTLTRAIIQIQSVKSKLLEPGYAYFRVTSSRSTAPRRWPRRSTSISRKTRADERHHPGSAQRSGRLLNGAVAISAAFLPSDALVVYTEGRTEDAKMKLYARPEYYLRGSRTTI